MSANFDIAAHNYDDTFTNGRIGRMQRERVWHYLTQNILSEKPLHILELNCGTGEDALFFAQKGHQVVATDISIEMVKATKAKVAAAKLDTQIEVRQLDMNRLIESKFPQPFDLIFSNFGGLNCLSQSELATLSAAAVRCLTPQGRFIGVIMPDYCLVESLYLFAKLKWSGIFRRKTTSLLLVNVDGEDVPTWYYSPTAFAAIFKKHFNTKSIKAMGFLPSYLEKLAQRNIPLIQVDQFLYSKFNLKNGSDHVLIDLQKKEIFEPQ